MDSTTLPSDTGDSPTGVIIGAIVGVVVVIGAIIAIVVIAVKCRKKKSKSESGRVSELQAAVSTVPAPQGNIRPGTERARTQALINPQVQSTTPGRAPLAPSNTAATARAGAAASALAAQYDNSGFFPDTSSSFTHPPSSSGSGPPPAAGAAGARPGMGHDNPAFDTTRASVYYVDVHNSNSSIAGTQRGQGQPAAGSVGSQRQPASGARSQQRGQLPQGQGPREQPPAYTPTAASGPRGTTTPGRPNAQANYYLNSPSEYVKPDAYINAGYTNEPRNQAQARPYAYPQSAGNYNNTQPPAYSATRTAAPPAAQSATRGPSSDGNTERRRNASADSSTDRRRHASGEGKASKSKQGGTNESRTAAANAAQPPPTTYQNLEEQSRARQQRQQQANTVTTREATAHRSPAHNSSGRRKKASKNAARERRAAARESKPGERYVSMPGGGSLSKATGAGHGGDVDLDASISLEDAKAMARTPSLQRGKRGYPQKQTVAAESGSDESGSDPDIDAVIPFDHPGGMIRKSSAKKFRAAGGRAPANDFNDLDAYIPFEDAGSAVADHDPELDVNVTLEA